MNGSVGVAQPWIHTPHIRPTSLSNQALPDRHIGQFNIRIQDAEQRRIAVQKSTVVILTKTQWLCISQLKQTETPCVNRKNNRLRQVVGQHNLTDQPPRGSINRDQQGKQPLAVTMTYHRDSDLRGGIRGTYNRGFGQNCFLSHGTFMILVTGGCGFIGSAFLLNWMAGRQEPAVNLDLLTYAGHPGNLTSIQDHPNYHFVHGDIGNSDLVTTILTQHRPRAVVHFAAESHVDRSISGPQAFIDTNVVGTLKLLQTVTEYWKNLPADEAANFRFLHVSTDEVFGSLSPSDPAFTEQRRFEPNSPYSASKAASDHLVRAWHHTFGLPTLTTNCSNNYGPRQFPEKLIPLMIHQALQGKPLPVYGDGQQIRDWLYVDDHCSAIEQVLTQGTPGGTWNVGGRSERTNLQVVHTLCDSLDALRPRPDGSSYRALITHVTDRPGHDRRYAIDDTKIAQELGWTPKMSFNKGMETTIAWYLNNQEWVASVTSGAYRQWVDTHYGKKAPT